MGGGGSAAGKVNLAAHMLCLLVRKREKELKEKAVKKKKKRLKDKVQEAREETLRWCVVYV